MGKESGEARKPRLQIGVADKYGNTVRVEVINTGGSVAKGSYGRVTIQHTKEDVADWVDVGMRDVFITPDTYTQVVNMNVCWAYKNNPKIDLPMRSSEVLQIAQLMPKGKISERSIFQIPSEEGWEHTRIFLYAKKYEVTVIVGADDVEPIERKFELGLTAEKGIYLQAST